MPLNPLPNGQILDVTKLEAFADNKLKVGKMMVSLFDRVENTVRKGENAGYQHFLLFPVFSKASFFRVVKSRDWVVNTLASALTETSILNTDQYMERQTPRQMDRQADSSIPPKTYVLWGSLIKVKHLPHIYVVKLVV